MDEFHVTFQALDWFWTVAYIILMVGCGVLFYNLGKRSESDVVTYILYHFAKKAVN